MGEIIIRKGVAKDMPEIRKLLRDLNDYQDYHMATPEVKTLVKDGFTDKPLFHMIVAETIHQNGVAEIIGMITYAFTYFISLGRAANMSGFYVKPNYRSQGIGKKLYEKALQEVFEQNGAIMVYTTHVDNNGSIKFYKNMGASEGTDELKLFLFWHLQEKNTIYAK